MGSTANLGVEKPATHEDFLELFLQGAFDDFDSPFKGFISGLQLEWLSVSGIRIKPGYASIPSSVAGGSEPGTGLAVTANIDKTGLSLSNSTWYHVYLYSNVGVPAAEVVTTDPVNYFGSAYQKTGDATRRYLGSVRTNGSGQIYNFLHVLPNFIRYRENLTATPFRVLSNGVATTATDVDLSAVVPLTSRLAHLRMKNTSATASALLGSSDGLTPGAVAGGSAYAGSGEGQTLAANLNSSRVLKYIYDAAPTNGLYLDVWGYWFER